MNNLRFAFILAMLFLMVIFVGCAPTPTAPPQIYTTVNEGTLNAGDAIPAPQEDVILTVSGAIGAANVGDQIEMDLPTIEAVGLVDYPVRDPFEEKDVVFQGVLMSELLALWQVPESATTLRMTALNDYVIEVPISDIRQYPVLFALKEDGAYMPVSNRGPAMLVYPYNQYEFDREIYDDRWIWQIKSVEVL